MIFLKIFETFVQFYSQYFVDGNRVYFSAKGTSKTASHRDDSKFDRRNSKIRTCACLHSNKSVPNLKARGSSCCLINTYSSEQICAPKKKKLHGLSPRANYTDRATAACRRSDCFAHKGCHVVSVTDPYGRIHDFLDRSRYFSIKQLLSCTHEAEWTPFQTHYFFFGSAGNRTLVSGSVARTLTTRPQRRSRLLITH
jgi:hypothetical protein